MKDQYAREQIVKVLAESVNRDNVLERRIDELFEKLGKNAPIETQIMAYWDIYQNSYHGSTDLRYDIRSEDRRDALTLFRRLIELLDTARHNNLELEDKLNLLNNKVIMLESEKSALIAQLGEKK